LAKKELAVASGQCTVSHLLLHHRIFYQKQHDCHPPPAVLFLVFTIEDDTNEVLAAGLQAMLNTLTENVFQAAFKEWQKLWEWD
jgi:hypothetical protein